MMVMTGFQITHEAVLMLRNSVAPLCVRQAWFYVFTRINLHLEEIQGAFLKSIDFHILVWKK